MGNTESLWHDYGLTLDRWVAGIALAVVVVTAGVGRPAGLVMWLIGVVYIAAVVSNLVRPDSPRGHSAAGALGVTFWGAIAAGLVRSCLADRCEVWQIGDSLLLPVFVGAYHVAAIRRVAFFATQGGLGRASGRGTDA